PALSAVSRTDCQGRCQGNKDLSLVLVQNEEVGMGLQETAERCAIADTLLAKSILGVILGKFVFKPSCTVWANQETVSGEGQNVVWPRHRHTEDRFSVLLNL
ncbi:hypothetical protein BaRGS_00014499, partial [Batillaria attramentaria]